MIHLQFPANQYFSNMYFWFNYVLKNNKHLVFKIFILFYYFISNSSDLISKNISKYKINTYGWQLFDDQRASRKAQLVVVCLSWMSRMNRVHHPCNILKKEFQAPCLLLGFINRTCPKNHVLLSAHLQKHI